MTHFFFFPVFLGFLPPFVASLSIFLDRISRIKSKNTLSTFSLVFADVSTYGTFQLSARFCAWDCDTSRFSVRSHLLPTKTKGMVSSLFTRRIWSRKSWQAYNTLSIVQLEFLVIVISFNPSFAIYFITNLPESYRLL